VDFRHSFEQALPVLLKEVAAAEQRARSGAERPTHTRNWRTWGAFCWNTPSGKTCTRPWPESHRGTGAVQYLRPTYCDRRDPHRPVVRRVLEEQEGPERPPHEGAVEQKHYTDILPPWLRCANWSSWANPGCGKTTTLWRIAADFAERPKRMRRPSARFRAAGRAGT